MKKPLILSLFFSCIIIILIIFIEKKFFVINNTSSHRVAQNDTSKYKYFYENMPSVQTIEKGASEGVTVTYHHNKDGLNSVNEYKVEKSKNVVRIATIGDSFTYGLNVDTNKNWPALLEKSLNTNSPCKKRFEILNFGVPGYDIDYSIERNILRAEKYKSDLYIWFVKDDDFSEPKELTLPIEEEINKTGKYSISYYLKALEIIYTKFSKEYIIEKEKSHLFDYIEKNNSSNFLLVIPKGDLIYPKISAQTEQKLINFAKTHKNVVIYPISITSKDVFLPDDFHLNEDGNRMFSKFLSDKMISLYCGDTN